MPSFIRRRASPGPLTSRMRYSLPSSSWLHEELNEFLDELLAQIVDVLNVSAAVVDLLDGDDAIIAVGLFARSLHTFDDADGAAFEEAAGEGGFVIGTRTSVGSPSSARVEGMKPKS
jgi:hypothetical protein